MPPIDPRILRLDLQGPECLLEEIVLGNVDRIAAGETLERITVRFDGKSYFVQDGFHSAPLQLASG